MRERDFYRCSSPQVLNCTPIDPTKILLICFLVDESEYYRVDSGAMKGTVLLIVGLVLLLHCAISVKQRKNDHHDMKSIQAVH